MQKILIVSNDYKELQNIYNNINKTLNSSIKIVGICNNEKDALLYLLNGNIDIIILDLDTKNAKILLDKILINSIVIKVILISKKTDSIVNIINNNIDIYQFFVKPINITKLIDTLYTFSESPKKIENKLTYLLKDFNFNKNTKGYLYILKCLTFCIENNYTSISSIKDLYKEIELKYNNISSSQLEWNISKAIQSMNNCTNKEIMNSFITYNNFPSPKIFINKILNTYYTKISESNEL